MFYGNFHKKTGKRDAYTHDGSSGLPSLFMKTWHARVLGIAVPFLIFLLPWITGYIIFMGVIATQKPQAPEMAADAIIVVTGDAYRINQGFDLLSAGKAQKMLISGVNEKVTLPALLAMWNGNNREDVDIRDIECCVTLGHAAENTNSNAAEARDWLQLNNLQSVRLVTSGYHMPRTSLAFRLALPDTPIYTHPVRNPYNSFFSPRHIVIGFREYNKTLLTLALSFLPE